MATYLLASSDEAARLQLQAQVWEPEAEALLNRIGIQPGWSCIDLGCGAMGILGPLSRRLGPNGHVVGLDQDTAFLEAARGYLSRENLSNVELIEGDIAHTQFDHSSFDFVHVRFVLPHVVSPQAVLAEMLRLTKPDGMVAVEEPDQSSWNFFPPILEWPRLKEILEAGFALRGDINIGRRTFGMLRELGLQDVRVRAAVLALQDEHPYMRLPMMAAKALREHLLNNGITTAPELNDLLDQVESAVNAPDTFQITFTTTQVWGQKPG